MPTPLPIQNAVQVRLLWSDPVRVFMNVLHMQFTNAGPLNPNIADTIFNSIVGNANFTTWRGFLPTTTEFTNVDVRDLRASNLPLITSTGTAVPGSSAGTALPPQTAMVTTLRTAQAGRAFRGRVYFGGLATNTDDGTGRIAPAANTAMLGAMSAVGQAMVSAGGTLAILQRALPDRPGHGGVTLPARPGAIVPVTDVVARDLIFDTQRRRSGARIGSR